MFEPGAESPLDELAASIRSVVGGVDVEQLDVRVAVRVVEQCAEAERVLAALRVMVTATLANKTLWRREGFRVHVSRRTGHVGMDSAAGSRR
jgi:hypothetical protein